MSNVKWNYNYQDNININESDEEENADTFGKSQSDSLIFVISIFPELFDEQQNWFRQIAQGCKSVMKNKALLAQKDFVAILFCNVNSDAAQSNCDVENLRVFQKLDYVNVQRIMQLDRLSKATRDEFAGQFGFSASHVAVYDALWKCQTIFNQWKSTNAGFKKIVYFVENQLQFAGQSNSNELRRTLAKFRDLTETNVEIEIVPICLDRSSSSSPSSSSSFDWPTFCARHLTAANHHHPLISCCSAAHSLDKIRQLMSRSSMREAKKRVLSHTRLHFLAPAGGGDDATGGDFTISCNVYSLVRKAEMPPHVLLHRQTNQLLSAKTRYFLAANQSAAQHIDDEEEGGEEGALNTPLMPHDFKKAIQIADRRVMFEPGEVRRMRQFHPGGRGGAAADGLLLLGFKSLAKLKSIHQVRASQFLQPDEKLIRGSTTAFSALLERCLAREQFALCRCVSRGATSFSFVALVPQREQISAPDEEGEQANEAAAGERGGAAAGERGVQLAPPGFHVIFLPFSDDYRKFDMEKLMPGGGKVVPSRGVIEAAKQFIRPLTVSNYNPEAICNPRLQKHFAYLENLAMNVATTTTNSADDETAGGVRVGHSLSASPSSSCVSVDQTKPNLEVFRSKAGAELEQFRCMLGLAEPDRMRDAAASSLANRKRRAADDATNQPDLSVHQLDTDQIKALLISGEIDKFTVLKIKEIAANHKISLKGKTKKAEFIDAMKKHFSV